MASNTVETHRSPPAEVGTEKRLSEARTPSYDGTREGDSWPDGGPSLGEYIEGYYDGDPPEDAPSNWGDLPQEARNWIAAKTLLGDPDASDVEDGISYPVVYPDEDLSESGLESARQMAGHADGAAESIRNVTERLLEDEFGHEFDSSESSRAREFNKHVDIKALDPTEQIAEGVVMVPNEVDHQGDFARGWAIRALEAGYSRRLEDGDVDHGVMHVKFPKGDIDVVDSRTLDTPQDIGNESYPADTWVIERKYHDDELWELVEDGIITGYSIGGIIPEGGGVKYSADGLPGDVRIPPNVTVDDDVFEIRAGWIDEISDVDAPAVPRAQVQTLKASLTDAAKATAEELTDPETAQELLEERGHTEEDAARLAAYLTKNHDMNDDTEKSSAEAASDADGAGADANAEADAEAEAEAEKAADVEADLEELGEEDVSFLKRLRAFFSGADDDTEKAGRRLSAQNQRRLMAAHDAIESALESELDDRYQTNRFTDNPRADFDLGDYDGKVADLDNPVALAKTITTGDFGRDSDGAEADAETEDESETETEADADADSDTTKHTDMTDETETEAAAEAEKAADADADSNETESMPEWAKSLADEVANLQEKLDTLEDEAEAEAEAEEDAEKAADAEAGAPPEWAADLVDKVEENAQRLDTVAKQGGVSQQLGDVDEDTLEQKRQELIEIENEVFD